MSTKSNTAHRAGRAETAPGLPTARLAFNGVDLVIVDHGGRKWLTGPHVADALGTSRQHVNNLWTRHADEFTSSMTDIIKQGRTRVRIFSLRGAHLLAMFARTPTAKAFRVWVLDVLERFGGEGPRPSVEQTTAVKAHTRRRAQPKAPALPFDLSRDGIGVIRMGGKLYLFDAEAELARDGDPVLAVVPERRGETPRLEVFRACTDRHRMTDMIHGDRTALLIDGENRNTGGYSARYTTVVGRVLAAAHPAAA